ncbi:hypothetical protein predicted by Glimmer/Critica [Bdellovibrio bacteriovorus HD100]|uniref:Uncharacterized protein n=1 Tax=Bdellovibrio bacteriovorus (strain ATCC 15356 / DSM 50701 / NCIMB 9529 / HD100) TaxID=264462 RepID=Q6MQQ1_BDEBA|nr:hypothetical protein predicted by Glimmer/Critica [Bdellovibrio bacteriovorus HD100]
MTLSAIFQSCIFLSQRPNFQKVFPQQKIEKKRQKLDSSSCIIFPKSKQGTVSQVPNINFTGARIAPYANGWHTFTEEEI